MSNYSKLSRRCVELERELAALKAKIPAQGIEGHVQWLIDTAGALIKAADLLIVGDTPSAEIGKGMK